MLLYRLSFPPRIARSSTPLTTHTDNTYRRKVYFWNLSGPVQRLDKGIVTSMTWGGLRAGSSVALALSLSAQENRSTIFAMTYAVVLFSLVAQGLSLTRVFNAVWAHTRKSRRGEYSRDSEDGGEGEGRTRSNSEMPPFPPSPHNEALLRGPYEKGGDGESLMHHRHHLDHHDGHHGGSNHHHPNYAPPYASHGGNRGGRGGGHIATAGPHSPPQANVRTPLLNGANDHYRNAPGDTYSAAGERRVEGGGGGQCTIGGRVR